MMIGHVVGRRERGGLPSSMIDCWWWGACASVRLASDVVEDELTYELNEEGQTVRF